MNAMQARQQTEGRTAARRGRSREQRTGTGSRAEGGAAAHRVHCKPAEAQWPERAGAAGSSWHAASSVRTHGQSSLPRQQHPVPARGRPPAPHRSRPRGAARACVPPHTSGQGANDARQQGPPTIRERRLARGHVPGEQTGISVASISPPLLPHASARARTGLAHVTGSSVCPCPPLPLPSSSHAILIPPLPSLRS